jgi:hypothetical protein
MRDRMAKPAASIVIGGQLWCFSRMLAGGAFNSHFSFRAGVLKGLR